MTNKTYNHGVCKGAIALGTGCMRCERCAEQLAARVKDLEAEIAAVGAGGVQALSAAPAGAMDFKEAWRVPCPWCRSTYTGRTFHKGSQVIECQNCLARGPQADDADAAKLAWATRAPTPPAEQQAQPGAAYAEMPDLIGTEINDACWAFVKAMPHDLPGPIWNDLKPAVHAAICRFLQAAPKAAPVERRNTKTHDLLSTVVGLLMGYREGAARQPYKPGSVIDKAVNEAVEHLKDWPYPEAAPQQEAQEPAEIPEAIERMANDRYKVVPSHESMFHRWAVVAGTGTQQLYVGRELECQNMARKFAGAFLDGAFVAMQSTAPQPAPAPLSDDVVKDAARYAALRDGSIEHDDILETVKDPGKWEQPYAVLLGGVALDSAIDAALAAQGGK